MAAVSEHTYIARQPILDARHQVYGYELLFRSREGTPAEEPGNASAQLLSDAVSGPGLETLCDGRRVFVNLSSDVLLSDVTGLFDPERVVFAMPVSAEIRGALLGEPNAGRQVLDAVARYERAEWLESSSAAAGVGLDEDTLPQAYLDALAWARKVTRAAGTAA
jgi:c-di-GMP-related signal transduction protein